MSTYLLWLDTETTGLNPRGDRLLSVGSIITTPDLQVIDTFEQDIGYSLNLDGRFQIHPAVVEMHEKSGLWKRCEKSDLTTAMVFRALREFWGKHVTDEDKAYLAGSTVWFDREFLMSNNFDPRSLLFMQYRMLDVSTFKVLGDLYGIEKPKAPEAHTPVADLYQSIADLKWWSEQLYLLDENMQLTLDGRGDLVGDP